MSTVSHAHSVACDSIAIEHASAGSLYPDHVIFLGDGSVVADADETVQQVLTRLQNDGLDAPVSILFPTFGTLMREDASPGQEALAQCLSDVCLRIPADASLKCLNEVDVDALMNWEAEHYRQQLEKSRTECHTAQLPDDSAIGQVDR